MALTPEMAKYDTDKNGKLEGAEVKAYANSLVNDASSSSSSSSNNPSAGTNTSTTKTKLTANTALAIMKLAAEDAGYAAKFTDADVKQFMKEFDAEEFAAKVCSLSDPDCESCGA